MGRTANREMLPVGYAEWLASLKSRIQQAQIRAALAASRELLALYWDIGRDIVLRQERDGWGSAVIERLSKDVQVAFPGLQGFSPRNLWRMRAFFLAYREARPPGVAELNEGGSGASFLPQAVAEIPWGHQVILLEKLKTQQERQLYARAALEHGWSRNMLALQIDSRLLARQGAAQTNFRSTLPAPQSDLAHQTLKDPYVFDFLTLTDHARERELEQGLMDHVQRFLLELGIGFAFVGRQAQLQVGEQDFYIDLLFYHLKLRCFVVIDLKANTFQPEYVGKLNFYLSAVDTQLRHPQDNPSIGLLLCKSRDRVVVEYALRDVTKPIGVADWETRIVESLPPELAGSLPTIEQFKSALDAKSDDEGD